MNIDIDQYCIRIDDAAMYRVVARVLDQNGKTWIGGLNNYTVRYTDWMPEIKGGICILVKDGSWCRKGNLWRSAFTKLLIKQEKLREIGGLEFATKFMVKK